MKTTFRQTTILIGSAAAAGLFAALVADSAAAQCGRRPRYSAAPYQRSVRSYRGWAPSTGYYRSSGAPVYSDQYAAAPTMPQPGPRGWGVGPGGDQGAVCFRRQPSAVPGGQPAESPQTHGMAPAERRSHVPAEAPPDPHAHPAAEAPPDPHAHPAAEAEAVAPPDLPPPVARDTQTLSEKQRICPVTGQQLGSMGKPYKVHVQGRDLLLCCQGCEAKFKSDPDKYLAKLNR